MQPEQPMKMERPQKREKQKIDAATVEKDKEPLLDDEGSSSDDSKASSEVSTGSFILMELLMMIPCLNIVMLIVWMCSKSNETRKHYATAKLIVAIISGAILAVLYFTVFATLVGSISSLGSMMY